VARIEGVQFFFLRYALRNLVWTDQLRLPPYEDRCGLLTLKTLNDRRNVFCVMFIRNLLEGAIGSRFLLSTMSINIPVYALRDHEMIRIDFHRTTYGQSEPVTFAIKKINDFSYLYRLRLSRDNFKERIMNEI
jgi:hypothetical protein